MYQYEYEIYVQTICAKNERSITFGIEVINFAILKDKKLTLCHGVMQTMMVLVMMMMWMLMLMRLMIMVVGRGRHVSP